MNSASTSDGEHTGQAGAVMDSEMNEQPRCLASLFARREEIIEQVRALAPRELAGTVLVARGSSDHAATCGAYFLEIASGRPVALTSPSIQTLYRARTDFRGYLMIAASQSGQTPEIVEVVERARAYGARAIAVTNEPASPLAAAADLVVDISAGRERAVPATKTVTAQVAVFATIAQAFGDLGLEARAAERLPGQVGEVLADLSPVEGLAEWLASSDRLLTVARGLLYGAAQEVALKVEETTARLTAAFSAADLRHGPIAIATSGAPVLAFVHPGPAASDVSDVVGDLRSRGAPTRVLGPVPGADFGWSSDVPEVLAPVLAIVRGQQLALSLARLLGLNPDAPAGLTKVTIT